MRLPDWPYKESIEILERGSAFPAYYENGDKVLWYSVWDFHHTYFVEFISRAHCQWVLMRGLDDMIESLMMGGEL